MRCAISMRMTSVCYSSGAVELRSALSADWTCFFSHFPDVTLMPVLNGMADVGQYLDDLAISAIILSGGENIGLFPERDATETAMLAYAVERAIPVLGICRGAQFINRYFGGADCAIEGHVATRHGARFLGVYDAGEVEVNSFHGLGITALGSGLKPLALCADGSVEAFASESMPIWGIMWHPEREAALAAHDKVIFSKIFKGKL